MTKQYKLQMLTMFGHNETKWENYHKTIVKYRDEFVAHLDENNTFIVPYLETALRLIFTHYEYLLQNEAEAGFFPEPIPNIQNYYEIHFEMARNVYVEFLPK
jgi:hypothetical protein